MIKSINKIKNLGIFVDYKKDSALNDFKRYNLLYGWNGSGKTTLSKLFYSLEIGDLAGYPDLEYEVEIEAGKYKQGQPFPEKIRVFNQDYISKNLRIFEGKTNAILILGEENQKLFDEIKRDEKILNGDSDDPALIGKIRQLEKEREKEEQNNKERGDLFTSIARTIGAVVGGEAVRSYTRRNAEPKFNELKEKQILAAGDLEKFSLILGQTEEEPLPFLKMPEVKRSGIDTDALTALKYCIVRSGDAFTSTVKSKLIERLRDNLDISKWVEEGLEIHKNHQSKNCEFCNQELPEGRLIELADHFNEADKRLKIEIDDLIGDLEDIRSKMEDLSLHDKARLYRNLQENYEKVMGKFISEREIITLKIKEVISSLENKKSHTTQKVEFSISIDDSSLMKELENLNSIIDQHNLMTSNFENEKKEAKEMVELHYLSTIYDDVEKINQAIGANKKERERLENGNPNDPNDFGILQIKKRIEENRSKISSAHKGCEEINKKLKDFLNRDDLVFQVENDGEEISGYIIKRGEAIANNISEGERTAIAFVYFIVQLTDQNFNSKEGIVVLDDPISSLDLGMLFRVCAFIEKELFRARQLFIFTHNYDFLNQVKKWFKINPDINGKRSEEEEWKGRFLMIENVFDDKLKKRVALIDDLDPMLEKYESEYHYLFKKLSQFDVDNPLDQKLPMRAIYDYPNIARKTLECFLSFRVPQGGSLYVLLQELRKINKDISEEDLAYVYGFVNSHSHLDTKSGLIQFDPTLLLSGRDSIHRTLKIIEQADPGHYKAMEKAVAKS